jgi:hypothetical protein
MFRGLIDQVLVFDAALSVDEIQALQAGTPSPAPEIHLDSLGADKLLLSWIGSKLELQTALEASGPWFASTNQAGAQLLQPSSSQRFFRLH